MNAVYAMRSEAVFWRNQPKGPRMSLAAAATYLYKTSPEKVKAIKAFRSNKTPGPHGITYSALKHAPRKFVLHMTNICNVMLRLRHFPFQWKQADVDMISKPGQFANWSQNYRPISPSPGDGGHSTSHQMLRIVEQIKEGFNLREYTGAIFLDIAKAFDKVWH
ncbi:hypothetical protein Trydic_g15017 [Trypoxylus dichotomus]